MMNQLLNNKIVTSCWIAAGVLTIVLLGAAARIKNHHECTGINVEVRNADESAFIGKDDVLDLINANGVLIGKDINTINLFVLENVLKQDKWIKDVQLFFDNQNMLEVYIKQRVPVARIFTVDENSFYIDAKGNRLPLTNKASARVLVVTGFTSNRDTLSSPDSMLLINTVKLVNKISQVNITPQATFELIPSLGNHLVEFGGADSIDNKLRKLKAFYKNVFYSKGMSAYTVLNVEYDKQVVASRMLSSSPIDTGGVHVDSTVANAMLNKVPVDTINAKNKIVKENNKENEAKLSVVKQNKPTDNSLSLIRTSVHRPENVRKIPVAKAVMGKN